MAEMPDGPKKEKELWNIRKQMDALKVEGLDWLHPSIGKPLA